MSNTYTIKEITPKTITFEFNIDGTKVTEKNDIRYVPVDSKEALDAYCAQWMNSWTPGESAPVAAEVQSLINKPQTVEVAE